MVVILTKKGFLISKQDIWEFDAPKASDYEHIVKREFGDCKEFTVYYEDKEAFGKMKAMCGRNYNEGFTTDYRVSTVIGNGTSNTVPNV